MIVGADDDEHFISSHEKNRVTDDNSGP